MSLPPGATLVSGSIPDASQLPPGATLVSGSLPSDKPAEQPGFLSQAWDKAVSMFPSKEEALRALGGSGVTAYHLATNPKEAFAKLAQESPGFAQAQEYERSRATGAGVGRSALNALGTMVGVNPAAEEAAAAQGNTAGVLADAAVPAAAAIAGPLAAEAGLGLKAPVTDALSRAKPGLASAAEVLQHPTEIPGRVAKAVINAIPDSPEVAAAKARAAQEAEGQSVVDAMKIQDPALRREAVAKAKADKAAAGPPKPFPATLGPETPTAKQLKSTQGAELSPIVKPSTSAIEGEGRPATWTNDYVTRQAAMGDTRAIQQARLRGLNLPPNANLVSNKAATVTPSVGTPKSVTLFDAQGNPVPSGGVAPMADVMAAKPAEPKYLYRIRPVGEKGVPAAAANSPAQLTTSLEQAESWVPGKNEEGPHEIIRIPTSSLKPGQTSARPFSPEIDWHKALQAIPESDVEVVRPHQAEVQSE